MIFNVTTEQVAYDLDTVARTLRHTADLIERDAEFPRLTIDREARDGYRHACLDLADAIEARTIAGGALARYR